MNANWYVENANNWTFEDIQNIAKLQAFKINPTVWQRFPTSKERLMTSKTPLEQPFPRPLSGEPVSELPSAQVPSRAPLRGNYVELVAQDASRHAADLYAAGHDSEAGLRIWDYLTYGPWASLDDYRATMRSQSATFMIFS